MNNSLPWKAEAAEAIGYKSKQTFITHCTRLAVGCIPLLLYPFMLFSGEEMELKNLVFLPAICSLLLVWGLWRVYKHKTSPDCIMRMDADTLYFWSNGGWVELPRTEISQIRLHTGRYNHENGDMTIYTTNGAKHLILDVQSFADVKAKIGI